MEVRIANSPDVFQSKNWRKKDKDGRKEWVHEKFQSLISKFDWNTKDTIVPIVPMVHGTTADIAWKICETGFVTLSTIDAGWFGKGIYFSSSAKYILPYYSSKQHPTILISYIIPGNAYPVTEHPKEANSLCGAALKGAHQSHYVVVEINGLPPKQKSSNRCFDELVITQEAQIIPVYILYPYTESILPLIQSYAIRAVVENERGKRLEEQGNLERNLLPKNY